MNPLRFRRPGQPQPLTETATNWVVRVERGNFTDIEREEFRRWLAMPGHLAAYEDVVWALDTLQSHAGSDELMAMRAQALAEDHSSRTVGRVAAAWPAIAATLIFALFIFGQPNFGSPISGIPEERIAEAGNKNKTQPNGHYQTGIGERSSAVLPDGSVVTLDTNSQLAIAFTSSERGVRLLRGQAVFEVAKGKTLPFRVYARDRQITALGTAFNVRLGKESVRIDMIEGVVNVGTFSTKGTPLATAPNVTLRTGESMVSTSDLASIIRPVEIDKIAPWRGGLLVFQDETLADAVSELNRYTEVPVKLADPVIGRYRVTGVFRTNDPEHFSRAMTEIFPVDVRRDPAGGVILVRK